MDRPDLPRPVASLVDQLAKLPNVVAVTLRGSRADRTTPTDSDLDLGLYYRGEFNTEDLSRLEGVATARGDWRGIPNGGARFIVDGSIIDIHFRDIEVVRHWVREAQNGRFEVDGVPGHLAGLPTYTLAAEVALDQVLAGSLDDLAEYPDRLATEGADVWRRHTQTSLDQADLQAARGDLAGVLGHLARASVEAAHAKLCEARRWTLNEKEILEQAELTHLNQILTALKADPVTLSQRVMQARMLLLD